MAPSTSLADRAAALASTARHRYGRRQLRPLAAGLCPRCRGRVELVTIGSTGPHRYRQEGHQVGLCPACNCVFDRLALTRPRRDDRTRADTETAARRHPG